MKNITNLTGGNAGEITLNVLMETVTRFDHDASGRFGWLFAQKFHFNLLRKLTRPASQ